MNFYYALAPLAACCAVFVAVFAPASPSPSLAPSPVLWAWERPEDLRFAGPDVTIAVLAGSVTLSGEQVLVRPRLQPAMILDTQRVAGVVHLEIDRIRPLPWTPVQRDRTKDAVLALVDNPRFAEVQIEVEVRASQRAVLLDLLGDVRAALPAARHLSMTALASWCDTETWIEAVPVDEVVPMLFRMGPGGEALRQRLADGGDFRQTRCRTAVGVATDTPPNRIPAGRRIWLFDPRAWNADDLSNIRGRLHA